MRTNEVLCGNESRLSILNGINKLRNSVDVTLGPKGRNVIIDRDDDVVVVNDGITIANSLRFSNRYEDMGARLVLQSALKTNEKSGDGTTTSVILTSELCKIGNKLVCDGFNPIELRNGMELALDYISDYINKRKSEVVSREYIESIANVSSGNKKLGKVVADAYEEVGFNGIVTFEESKSNRTFVDVVDGMMFDSGYMSPYFINQPQKRECVLENPYVLISDMKLYNVDDIYPLLEKVVNDGRSLLIIADDVDGLALSTIIKNVMAGNLNCCCVKAPSYGETRDTLLKDIALFTNGRNVSEKLSDDFKTITFEDIGEASRVVITDTECTITTNCQTDKLKNEIKLVSDMIANFDNDDKIVDDKHVLEERLARLSGKVAVVKVGGSTEVEMIESKLRVEDAINAVRVSIESGVVVGEGRMYLDSRSYVMDTAYISVREKYSDSVFNGFLAVLDVLEVPFRTIFRNAGVCKEVVDEYVRNLYSDETGLGGYDVFSGKYIDNLFEYGVIDPVSVSVGALENAVSVASMFITTEVAITFDGDNIGSPMM